MIPFSPPRIDEKTIEEVTKTLRSGWITTGPKTKLFEQQLKEYFGSREVLCVSSATAGLELMLHWYGVGPGDEVIVPAYTYCATANVVVHCGAKPVIVDVADDFNIALEQIEQHITERTKVVMPVDIGGWPCDYDAINELVSRAEVKKLFTPNSTQQKQLGRILVLSDSAHSLGAVYKGEKTGNVTDISVFSFHAVKNLTTSEGGAVSLNLPAPFDNEEIYKDLNVMSLHGQSKDALSKFQKGGWRYDVLNAGFKYNMTDIQAAIGVVELARYESETLPRRKQIFEAYSSFFKEHDWAETPLYISDELESSYHVYLLRVKDITEEQRDQIIDEVFRQQVSVNVHFQPLPMLSYYKEAGYKIKDVPNAYENYCREISLPVYYDLSDQDVQTVCEAVLHAYRTVHASITI